MTVHPRSGPVRRPPWLRRTTVLAAVGLSAAVLTTAPADGSPAGPAGAVAAAVPAGCRTGLGDRVHPELGTPGVRIRGYTAVLTFAPGLREYAATTSVSGSVAGGRPLRCLALDFSGGTVRAVRMRGHDLPFRVSGQKLYVLPARPLRGGTAFAVTVSTASPVPDVARIGPDDVPPGIFGDGTWVQVLAQPSAAHRVLPMADHPAQKAPWTFDLRVPRGAAAVANGRTVLHRASGGRERYVYRTAAPMATHVMQIAVGPLREVSQGTAAGVRVRHWLPRTGAGRAVTTLATTGTQIAWLTARLGPYPFGEYGVLATPFGGELETQTLTTLAVDELQTPEEADGVLLHELAHQWFGDSVSVRRWGSDLWLAEGHAVYYETLYPAADVSAATDERMRRSYGQLQALIDRDGPIARPRYDSTSPQAAAAPYSAVPYQGGALALYALRNKVGAAAFRQIERAWVRTYRGRSAGTAEFVALASRVSRQDLTGFLGRWLYGTTVPPMPGHPTWKP